MKTLLARRAKVRTLRDKAIQRARDECKRTLARIATMEFNRRTMLSTCVESVIPDHEFTVLDILAALESVDPVRVWRRHAVNNHISRMLDRGQIRRTKRSCGRTEPATYARVEVDVPVRPFANLSVAGPGHRGRPWVSRDERDRVDRRDYRIRLRNQYGAEGAKGRRCGGRRKGDR